MSGRRREGMDGRLAARLIIAVVALATLTGCAVATTTTNRVREAQDAFSQAAAADNAVRQLDAAGRDPRAVTDLATSRSGYASVLVSLDKLAPAEVAQLKRDQLWGNVLTLRALSQWRLGNYDAAVAIADDALRAAATGGAGTEIHPRDRALLQALRGLVKNDQAYRKIASTQLEGVGELLAGGNGAIADLIEAQKAVDRGDPVQFYLLQAQLAAYRNFTLFYAAANKQQGVPANHAERERAGVALRNLSDLLKQARPEDQVAWVTYWSRLCGLAMPPP